MPDPTVSVIVPNYNHSLYLRRRLESIYIQTFQDFEVILLDDVSTDDSRIILEEYRNHPKTSHVIFNKKNSGSTFYQWQKGIELSKGDYIWIAESDDFCENNFLKENLNLHYSGKNIGLSFCESFRINSSNKIHGIWKNKTSVENAKLFEENFKMDGPSFILNYLLERNFIPNASAVLFNKVALLKITPLYFKPHMRYYADWYYYMQILCFSNVAFLSTPLNYFRYHDTSVIGKAHRESGVQKILKMEIRGRRSMIKYFIEHTTVDKKMAKSNGKKAINNLIRLTAIGLFSERKYLQSASVLFSEPMVFFKLLMNYLSKRCHKFQ